MKLAKIMKVLIFTALIASGTLGAPIHAQINVSSSGGGGADVIVFDIVDSVKDNSHEQERDNELVDEGSAADEGQQPVSEDKPEYKYVSIRRY